MCSADIFLGVLAILFPPLPGTSTNPISVPFISPSSSFLATHRVLTNTPSLSRSLGQARHLQRRLPHQHPPLHPRLHPRPPPRLVHHRQVPRAALRIRRRPQRRALRQQPRHLRLRPVPSRTSPPAAQAAGRQRPHELRDDLAATTPQPVASAAAAWGDGLGRGQL